MRGMITFIGLAALAMAPIAQAQDVTAGGQMASQLVGVLTRADGFQQTTLITHSGALGFAVPGDWKVIQLDFKLPVATAVYDVPDPSALDGVSNTNCSMAFADPTTPEGQAVVARAAALGGDNTSHDGWAVHARTDTADTTSPTAEMVATRAQGFVTAVAMCAWPKGGTHDATYDAYMTRQFTALLGSVQAPAAPFKARPGETFFSPQ